MRSADGGITWTLIRHTEDILNGNHSFGGLGFAGFAWSTVSQGTVVAAVSDALEGILVNAVDPVNSVMGLYYSTDSGVSWKMGAIKDGGQTVQTPSVTNHGGNAATAVVWNAMRQRFYAAVRFHGYYESADGITWTRLAHQPGTGLTTTACPTNPNTMGSANCPVFRGTLAVQPVTGDMFALTVDRNNRDQGLWQDICGLSGESRCSNALTFGTKLESSSLQIGGGSTVIPQADYDMALAAVPSGPVGPTQDTLIFAGTVDLYRCSMRAGCSTLRNTTNAGNGCGGTSKVAPAQHAIAALATSSQPLVYVGNDGGLWRSTDGVNETGTACSADDANHFENLNGGLGSLAEVASFAQHPTDSGALLVGLGANGTAGTSNAASNTPWQQLSAGEGGMVAIDQNNPLLWYVSTGAGVRIRQCTSGAGCTAADFTGAATLGSAQVGGDASLVDAPFLLDPALSSSAIIGTCRVWRGPANNGALWSSSNAISKILGGPKSPACIGTSSMIRALAAGGSASNATAAQNAGSQVLYAGMAGALNGGNSYGGHLFSTTTGGTASDTTSWADLAASPVESSGTVPRTFNPGGFDISSIAVDPHDATGKTVYVTVMGFGGNTVVDGVSHVYRSIDGGSHWTIIDSNLPNAPTNSIVVDPNDANTLYVALDTGVYVTTQVTTCPTGNCWSIYGTNLPNAPVIGLAAGSGLTTGDGRAGRLRAATYGRGIWQIPLLTVSTAAQAALKLNPAALTFSSQAVTTASATQTIIVTNTGSAPLTISQIHVTGDFTEADTCLAMPIASNSTCTMLIRFLPTATGSRTGTLTIFGNIDGGQATASLTGTGTAADAIVLTPLVLSFASTTINATSARQNITISNTGAAVAVLQVSSISGDFRIVANTCGATLAPNTGCTVSIVFAPTASGVRTGGFTIVDDAGTQTALLTGTGTVACDRRARTHYSYVRTATAWDCKRVEDHHTDQLRRRRAYAD